VDTWHACNVGGREGGRQEGVRGEITAWRRRLQQKPRELTYRWVFKAKRESFRLNLSPFIVI